MFNFVADRIVNGRMYPALAKHQAMPFTQSWREFAQHWPHTVPFDIHDFCNLFDFPVQIWCTEQNYPADSFYAIQLSWFDFCIDYFSLVPKSVRQKLQHGHIKLLFYYNEGDNPANIQLRLSMLQQKHALPASSWHCVSANSAATQCSNMNYLAGHELIYWWRNRDHAPLPVHHDARSYNFTILNRTHKWWRATAMADLQRHGVLDSSQWSYNSTIQINETRSDNPIQEDYDPDLRAKVTEFVAQGPYRCDSASDQQHNDHTRLDTHLFADSYCHIVVETHFDADGSNGVFLTEKTFKAIKHGQPFVIAGTPGSINQLRHMGYRCFDSVIDHSYDSITDNTQRWQCLLREIERLNSSNMREIFEACVPDLIHNQHVFANSKHSRLQQLWHNINEKTQQLHILAAT